MKKTTEPLEEDVLRMTLAGIHLKRKLGLGYSCDVDQTPTTIDSDYRDELNKEK